MPVVHNDSGTAEPFHFRENMRVKKQRYAIGFQVFKDYPELSDPYRIESIYRFIEY